jgi:hypothetical protein
MTRAKKENVSMKSRWTLAAALVLSGALTLGACSGKVATQNNAGPAASGSANRDGTDNMIEQLTLPAEVADNVAGIENYNPWSPSSTSKTYFYEPLMIRSSMNCQVVPWLATDYKWEGPTKLSFTIRDGVKWSDGQPLTAEDVAFTLNMKKQYPALDDIGLWSDTFGGSAKSVIVDGNKVVIDFTGNAAAKFDRLRCPDDILITGFDDIMLARYTMPGLTTVRQPIRELASLLAQRLHERITSGGAPRESMTLTCEVVIRGSCGCPE